jgi:hypothetical protein
MPAVESQPGPPAAPETQTPVADPPQLGLLSPARPLELPAIFTGLHEPLVEEKTTQAVEPVVKVEPRESPRKSPRQIPVVTALGSPAVPQTEVDPDGFELPHPRVFVPLRHTDTGPSRDEFVTDLDVERYLSVEKPPEPERRAEPIAPRAPLSTAPERVPTPVAAVTTVPQADHEPHEAEQPAVVAPDLILSATLDEGVELRLEGAGWMFTGVAPQTGGIVFVDRRIDNHSTTFLFDSLQVGDFRLTFLRQDSATGTTERVDGQVAVRANPESLPVAEERVVDAVVPLLLSEDPPLPARERVREYAQARDWANIRLELDDFLLSADTRDGQLLLSISEGLLENGDHEAAASCLEGYIDIFPGIAGNDRLLLELGRMYEQEPMRNERQAHLYYSQLLDIYPASIYYDEADARAKYLERHFLKLR